MDNSSQLRPSAITKNPVRGRSAIQENWTVEAWLTHWLEHLSRPFVKQGTYEGYRAAVNVHLIPGIGRHRLHTLRA